MKWFAVDKSASVTGPTHVQGFIRRAHGPQRMVLLMADICHPARQRCAVGGRRPRRSGKEAGCLLRPPQEPHRACSPFLPRAQGFYRGQVSGTPLPVKILDARKAGVSRERCARSVCGLAQSPSFTTERSSPEPRSRCQPRASPATRPLETRLCCSCSSCLLLMRPGNKPQGHSRNVAASPAFNGRKNNNSALTEMEIKEYLP